MSELIEPIIRNWTGKEGELKILEYREEQIKREEKKEKDKIKGYQKKGTITDSGQRNNRDDWHT